MGIWHLTLKPGSSVLNDPNIQMLYVEYRFLDYPLEEMETPFSLPKPIPPDVITYGYQKGDQLTLIFELCSTHTTQP